MKPLSPDVYVLAQLAKRKEWDVLRDWMEAQKQLAINTLTMCDPEKTGEIGALQREIRTYDGIIRHVETMAKWVDQEAAKATK
jgi:hypothetical protein